MTTGSLQRISSTAAVPRAFSVRSWPARDAGWWLLAPVLLTAAVTAMVAFATGHPGQTLAALLVLLITQWRWWLPVTFEVDRAGFTERVLGWRRRIAWLAVGGFEITSRGLRVWPAGCSTLTAALRSIHIPAGEHRDALLAIANEYADRALDRGRPVHEAAPSGSNAP